LLKALAEGPLVITGAILIVIVLNFRHGMSGTPARFHDDPGNWPLRVRRQIIPALDYEAAGTDEANYGDEPVRVSAAGLLAGRAASCHP
jgi:hypothetical protein